MPSRDFTNEDLFSSRMMSMHSSTHSSQMNTVGPAISLRTSCWLLPQNEQYSVFFSWAIRFSQPGGPPPQSRSEPTPDRMPTTVAAAIQLNWESQTQSEHATGAQIKIGLKTHWQPH